MKKPTSKSVSGTPRISSPSGTSAPTDDTGNKPARKGRPKGKFAKVVARVEDMDLEEFRQSLVVADITTKSGKLKKKYKSKKD